ncbi:ImcF-related family protein [Pseudomonas turukhanskensis]|uniref:Type VI secretion protein VasK n=1 Tax=Pseudomonas turukhanskensis TaxID=1806536 RepID=A0A9W6NG26_9PSED|nr:type VI secretion protein VasK [Pseudomonas turukhanskensis]
MREQLGTFWRHQARILLVTGELEEIELLAPGLTHRGWLHDQHTVLLWVGVSQAKPDLDLLKQWRSLRPWRPLDGIVWVLNKAQRDNPAAMAAGAGFLQGVVQALRWRAPLHLWQLCASEWPQPARPEQAVGCVLPAVVDATQFQVFLQALLQPLFRQGLAQLQANTSHDFLWRLGRDLQAEGIARWGQALASLLERPSRHVRLRGVWFSLLPPSSGEGRAQPAWRLSPAWAGVVEDRARGRRLGWAGPRVLYAALLVVVGLAAVGLVLSFVSNQMLIGQTQHRLAALEQAGGSDEQVLALHELVHEVARLEHRERAGVPWFQRWGLSRNEALLAALWPRYGEANNQLLRDPLAAGLHAQLSALVALPAQSPQRAQRAVEAYDLLKAYLMMARPERSDRVFLASALAAVAPLPNSPSDGVTPSRWQALSPGLAEFYTVHLAAHPHWKIRADMPLVARVRQVLLSELGQRNAEASLYQQVLDAAAINYPALGLDQLVGETDAQALFATTASVPGMYTRQAWEGQVRQAIDEIAEAHREKIDWVLSDAPAELGSALSPEQLKQRLVARYFQDYSNAWLRFLTSLRWQKAASLAQVIDQLTVMSDVRQSPLIALLNTLAYQGQAGSRKPALTDTLLDSAQRLLATTPVAMIDQRAQSPDGPLTATFAPLLALLGKGEEGSDEPHLSVQALLTRVTRVRLTLQQVSSAQDPQHMTQALAQTVFQGKGVDLTDTRAYGRLLAASLGAEWGGIGQTLFVQPLEQAWERVLQPSAAALNRHWQRTIVGPWEQAFTGRYPFAATTSSASLPMLGQMIRADSGRIEQFLQRELAGVLRKEGSHWVADPSHSQGLRFNPAFLTAIGQLSQLADVLFTDGGMGLGFELQAKPVQGVVQTTLILDGQRLHYFNQMERWQRFIWPGVGDHPGASLTWTSLRGGERLFGDFAGPWGLIRLLELAQVSALDDSDSRYRLQLKTADNLLLTWHLRTELDAGPLALLRLRGFRLPTQIFLDEPRGSARAEERL